MTTPRAPFPLRLLLRPKNWPLLLVVAAGRAVAFLPLGAMPALGRPLAWALWRWPKLARVTRANLAACLPHLPEAERERLARASTGHLATALLTALKVWFSYRPGHPAFAARFEGLAHFEAARDTGRGIILLNCHYNSTELNGAFTAQLPRGDRTLTGLYRAPSDPAADAVLQWARTGFSDRVLPARDVRTIAKGLKAGDVTWFATDLEFGGRGSVWAEFFGIPAATSNSLARLAGMSGAIVLPVRLRRDGAGHVLQVFPPLAGFPSGDAEADATAMNRAIEALIADDPAPYWWCLERFRKRPPGVPPVYPPARPPV
ncbi:lysophospholipid acyltransferase family protein [Roseicyclus sp.]|uniref:lysophospholipid acyltransferase family protein n=1 Tax=Roseicyclus sp. TaxID=1914329 RepID=UPI003FA0615F